MWTACSAQYEVRKAPWFDGERDATRTIKDDLGRVWIATRNKLFIDDGHGLVVVKENPESNVPLIFGGSMITRLYDDHSGNIWIGTKGAGLYSINIWTGYIDHWHLYVASRI
jgi:ligand-binding sensor domain-containing protein